MPSFVRATVELPYRTGNPEDVSTNTWFFESDTLSYDDTIAALSAPIGDFYEALVSHLSPSLEGGDCSISFYNMLIPAPRPPTTAAMPLNTVPTTTPLPLEVAACLSFRTAPPQSASRRGRVYLGPLNTSALNKDAIGRPVVNASFFTAVQAGLVVLGNIVDQSTIRHVIYSRLNAITFGVTHYWMNDEFDTQRRRQSVLDTTRTTWTAPQ